MHLMPKLASVLNECLLYETEGLQHFAFLTAYPTTHNIHGLEAANQFTSEINYEMG